MANLEANPLTNKALRAYMRWDMFREAPKDEKMIQAVEVLRGEFTLLDKAIKARHEVSSD